MDDLPDAPWLAQQDLPDAPWEAQQAAPQQGTDSLPDAPWEAPQPPEGQPAPDSDQREGGLLQTVPKAAELLSTPEGRAALWQGVKKLPGDMLQGVLQPFEVIGRMAAGEPVSPEEQSDAAINLAMMTVGARATPKAWLKATSPVIQAFDETVTAPVAMKLAERAPDHPAGPVEPMLAQARDLGVIGPEKPPLNELPPQEAGKQAMAAQRPDETIGGEASQQQTAWRQRWERTLDKMNVPEDARRVISAAVDANDEFIQARQGNMTHGQVEQLADVTGLDSSKIDIAGTSAKIKTDVEMRNSIEAFRAVNDRIVEAAKDLRDKGGVDDEAEAIALTRLEMQRDLLLDATTTSKQLAAVRAEFGRTGNVLQEFQKAVAETNGYRQFIKDKQGRGIDDIRDRAKMIADTPPNALPKVMEAMREKQPGWLFWTWQQGLISGPFTHTKYLGVNMSTVYLERVIAPEVAAAIGKMRGDKTSMMAPLWANVGMIRALPDALTAAGQAFKSGLRVPLESELELTRRAVENPELKGGQTPYVNSLGPNWGIWKNVFNEDQLAAAAKVLGIPGKSANMIHTFFKVLSERASASSRAYEAAFQEGVKEDDFSNSYQQHLLNPSDEALKGAVDDAYSGAFMSKLGDKIGSLALALKDNPVTKWLFPFQHIPWNIERMTIEYSPLAVFGPEMRSALLGEKGRPAQNLALAKMAVGTSLIGYFVNKGLSGEATGDYPHDPTERRRWALLRIQPNSVNIGGQWISTERLGPPGNLARLGANFGEIIRNYNGQDDQAMMKASWALAMAFVNQIADETGFQTTRNFIDALDGRQSPARFLAWQAGSLMPFSSLSSQTASFMDPQMRVAETLLDGLKYRIPFLRETLLPKRDPAFGEPLPNPGYHTVLRQNPVSIDPVVQAMDAVGYYPMPPGKQIGKVTLTPEQYDRYEATAGPLAHKLLEKLISAPGWQQVPPELRKETMQAMISAARMKARSAMQIENPELIQQGIDLAKKRITGP